LIYLKLLLREGLVVNLRDHSAIAFEMKVPLPEGRIASFCPSLAPGCASYNLLSVPLVLFSTLDIICFFQAIGDVTDLQLQIPQSMKIKA
jgi:hypothetical protein